MTPKQRSALVIIERCIAVNGFAPSLIELAKGLGIVSKGSAHGTVASLIERGYLARESNGRPGRNRDLIVTPQGHAALRPRSELATIPTELLLSELEARRAEGRL